ncbi:ABC transporter permease [Planosporangium mesophilum]|uniref:Sugar ABC transporter permease n=1 Tax=Planosporangium mesophilum TaxID=689768 RepID=A0A8J3X2X9_9ACTN|nr:ABC transporter permease [Planosporangium mesophilum]NJC86376.1 ABC transporter permease [Planosporangium mesophilum]GII25987.1 sugar ABC transporter permease [Planosporangium mesophilum]
MSLTSWRRLTRHQLFWPATILVALLLFNLPFTPGFLAVGVRNGHLYGSLVSILVFGTPLILVALGMTMVIATGGIDLSVGAVMAISGALACSYISRQPDQNAVTAALTAVALALVVSLLLGAWNGLLVARAGVQPIIATLVLMVAGRGIAQLITGGFIITVQSRPYQTIGGYLFTLPTGVFIAVAAVVGTLAVTRRTALGLLVESVGGNAEASRLAGVRAQRITILVYVFCALCAGVAGLMNSSNLANADANNAGLWIELDAILAVVIGGTPLTGGRFSLGGTVLGALILQTLKTTIYTIGVPSQANMVFEAAVVIIVCLIQSPDFRRRATAPFRGGTRTGSPPVRQPAGVDTPVEARP